MIKIDNSMKITMFVGDTGHISLSLRKNGEPYELQDNVDVIIFSVKKKLSDLNYVLQKTIEIFDNGKAVISFNTQDTLDLEPNIIENIVNEDFPHYLYDIEWRSEGNVHTIMKNFKLGRFVLVKGVTENTVGGV